MINPNEPPIVETASQCNLGTKAVDDLTKASTKNTSTDPSPERSSTGELSSEKGIKKKTSKRQRKVKKELSESTKSKLSSPKGKIKFKILSQVAEVLKRKGLSVQGSGITTQFWISFHTKLGRNAYFRGSMAKGNRFRVEVYLQGDKPHRTNRGKELYAFLEQHKEEIVAGFGDIQLSFEPLPTKMASRIAVYRNWPKPATPETLEKDSKAAIAWFEEMFLKFRDVIDPILESYR